MRSFLFTRLFVLILLAAISGFAQQTASTDPQAAAAVQKALAALSSATTLTDATLSGTARRIAGSDDETGTAILKITAAGSCRLDLTLPSGARSEVRTASSSGPAGKWSGPDGAAHSTAYHNLSTDAGWFPAFTLTGLSASNGLVKFIGQETRNGVAVLHLSAAQRSTLSDANAASFVQHLSQTEVFLDASSYLPVAVTFNTHPDSNALLDIPVEMRFSDYRAVNGAQIPFHVQKFLNNSLILDLQFQNVSVNSGLSAGDFVIP